MGDVGTIEWAEEFMNSHHKDPWMAHYAIAYSPLDRVDELAKPIINGADTEGLVSLIQGYEKSHNPNRIERLRDIIALKYRDSEVNDWLVRILKDIESRGDKRATELLLTLRN